MFINKAADKRNNICGKNVVVFRKEMEISQRELADRLQLIGLDIDKNAVQRIESGQRFVTDIELIALSKACPIRSTICSSEIRVIRKPYNKKILTLTNEDFLCAAKSYY